MIRNGQRWFFRAIGVLGLLLAVQLAYGGEICVSPWDMEPTASQAVFQGPCAEASTASLMCVATPQRIDASVTASAPLPLDPQPSAVAPYYASGIPFAAVQPRMAAGPAPGFPLPVYIRFGRFLS